MENLSRGMQQKVALARALLTSPVLLLLDEPTTGLDPRSKREVQDFIREIRAEHDATILLCTHDMVEAEVLAERVGIIDRGRLPAAGAPGRAAPRTARRPGGGVPGRDRPRARQPPTRTTTRTTTTGRCSREHDDPDAARVRDNLVGLGGVVERNVYLTRRYIWWDLAFFVWTIANTLTIVFIADGVQAAGGSIDVGRATTFLLIGAVIWAYLGIIFEFMTETVAWERWEGTIEYTFMAPLGRFTHLAGMGAYSVLYGLIRAVGLFLVVGLFFDLSMPDADFLAALVVLLVASVSFIGIGMMAAVLPLISPEKGAQLGFVAQGVLLVVSGVYYPVDVLPTWMEKLAAVSPATYALDGVRRAILDGDGLSTMGPDLLKLPSSARCASRPGWRCSPPASGTPSATASSSGPAEPTRSGRAADSDVEAERAQLLAAVVGDLVRTPRRHPDPVDLEVGRQPPPGPRQRLPGLVLDDVGQRAGRRGQRHVQRDDAGRRRPARRRPGRGRRR